MANDLKIKVTLLEFKSEKYDMETILAQVGFPRSNYLQGQALKPSYHDFIVNCEKFYVRDGALNFIVIKKGKRIIKGYSLSHVKSWEQLSY